MAASEVGAEHENLVAHSVHCLDRVVRFVRTDIGPDKVARFQRHPWCSTAATSSTALLMTLLMTALMTPLLSGLTNPAGHERRRAAGSLPARAPWQTHSHRPQVRASHEEAREGGGNAAEKARAAEEAAAEAAAEEEASNVVQLRRT
jgi:hypothetical protein